jgi:hypothetical protein
LENSRKSIINSADNILNAGFIGEQREAIIKSTEVLNDVILMEQPVVQKYLNIIKDKIAKSYKGLDAKNTIAKKAEESLLSYLIQTSTGLNTILERDLVNKETALVNELKKLKETLKNNPDTIGGNIILNNLIPSIKGKNSKATKNIKLAIQPRDVFSKNIYADAFEELLRNPITERFAKNLLQLHFLQNGIASSPISLKDIIPARLFAQVVNRGIDNLYNEEMLNDFIVTNSFYKNNFNNSDIVKDVSFDSEFPGYEVDKNITKTIKEFIDKNVEGNKKPLILFVDSFKGDYTSPVVKRTDVIDEGTDRETTISRLFKRVENSFGEPITLKTYNEEMSVQTGRDVYDNKTIYIQINALGDGFRAQEYYRNNRPSVFQNGFEKTPEINIEEVANLLSPIEPSKTNITSEDFKCK